MLVALGIQHVERIAKGAEKIVAGVEALWGGKAHIVGIERVGYNQVRADLTG